MKPCGYAAHVDSMDEIRSPTLPTIAWTTLRVAHISTRSATNLCQAERTTNNVKNIAAQEGYELN